MRILVVTGRLAGPRARQLARQAPPGIRVDVVVLNVPVAAMMTAEQVAHQLSGKRLRNYDLVLVPGLMRGNASLISEALGVEAWKGPRHIGDLPAVLRAVAEGRRLSPSRPADEVLHGLLLGDLAARLRRAEERCRGPWVKGLCIAVRPPPIRIAVELPPSIPPERLAAEARRVVSAGADIVVVGVGSEQEEGDARLRVREARRAVDLPVAIDAGGPEALAAGIEAGADMAMSIYKGYAEALEPYGSRAVFVAVPSRGRGVPRSPAARIRVLAEILDEAERHGLARLVIDPVLLPPMQGLAESLEAYVRVARRFPSYPIMMGIANVTELIDADSIGVNAVLTSIAVEAGASLLLVTEESWKARGSIAETRIASFMASAAALQGSPPKDLGIDLLVVKEKRPRSLAEEGIPEKLVVVDRSVEHQRLDPAGYVKIQVVERMVEACLYPHGAEKPRLCVRGRHGLSVVRVLCREAGINDPDHVSYLAYEASKAEIAALLGRSYVQEEPLFVSVEERLRLLKSLGKDDDQQQDQQAQHRRGPG